MPDSFSQNRSTDATALGELAAAKEVLAVSQKQLTRVQTLGYDTVNEQDRLFRRTPNYRSMPYPVVQGPSILQTFDPNSMGNGRESIHAEQFASPWQGLDAVSGNPKPLFSTPTSAFAPSGDLDQMYEASYAAGVRNAQGGKSAYPSASLFDEDGSADHAQLVASMVASISGIMDELPHTPINPVGGAPDSFSTFKGVTYDRGNELDPMTLDFPQAETYYGSSRYDTVQEKMALSSNPTAPSSTTTAGYYQSSSEALRGARPSSSSPAEKEKYEIGGQQMGAALLLGEDDEVPASRPSVFASACPECFTISCITKISLRWIWRRPLAAAS